MGLFKKRTDDPDEIARLRSEIAAMSARIEASDATKQEVWTKVDDIAARLEEAPEPQPVTPPDAVSRGELDLLNAKVGRLTEQLEEAIEAGEEAAQDATGEIEQIDTLRERLDALAARLDTPMATPAPPPPPGPDATDTPVDLSRVEERIDELVARIGEVDARISSISGELANQISEISDDLDARGPTVPPTDGVVDELRDAQVRLANEQARYQIAFRQDLADLAARLRRA